MNRRNFLQLSSATVAGSTIGSIAIAPSSLAVSPIGRTGGPRFSIGLAAYSLRDYFPYFRGKKITPKEDGKAIDMVGFLDYCVEQGFDAGELTAYFFKPDADDAYYREIKRQAFIRGVAVSGTGTNNYFTRGKDLIPKEIEKVKYWIDRAVLFGAPHIRLFPGNRPHIDKDPKKLQESIDAINDCAVYAKKKGVYLSIENHGNLTVEEMLTIMKNVDNEWVGINLDSANFFSETPYKDLEKCVPYAINVQVKPSMIKPDGKTHYPVDYDRVGNLLKDGGYQGFVILEYEDEKPYENIPAAHEKLRAALA